MATPESIPSSQRVVPGSVDIPIAQWPASTKDDAVDAPAVAAKVIDSLNESLLKKDHKAVADLFLENSYWRDHLGMSWDFRTMKGRDKIISFLDKGHHLVNVEIDMNYPFKHDGPKLATFRGDGSSPGIECYLRTGTKYGIGPGLIRLIQENGRWKIWTLYTCMNELHIHPEPFGSFRPKGVQHGLRVGRENWLDRRQAEFNFENRDPDVLIIGMFCYIIK